MASCQHSGSVVAGGLDLFDRLVDGDFLLLGAVHVAQDHDSLGHLVPAEVEAADVALMSDDLTKVSQVIRLGQAPLKTICQDLVFALAFNAVALILASGGVLSMVDGAILHQGSSLLVAINSMRLLLYRPEQVDR